MSTEKPKNVPSTPEQDEIIMGILAKARLEIYERTGYKLRITAVDPTDPCWYNGKEEKNGWEQ